MLFLRCPASKAMEEGVKGRGTRIAEVISLGKQRLEEEGCRSRQGGTVRNGEIKDWQFELEKRAEKCYRMRWTKGNNVE